MIEVSPTAFQHLISTFKVRPRPLTLTFDPIRAMIVTHTHAKGQGRDEVLFKFQSVRQSPRVK